MEKLQKILRTFSDLRDKYSDIETAIEAVCISTKLDQIEVLGVLSMTGVYVLPDSEEEREIKRFISSADMAKTTVNGLAREVGFRFCISNRESKRLVEKWLNHSGGIIT